MDHDRGDSPSAIPPGFGFSGGTAGCPTTEGSGKISEPEYRHLLRGGSSEHSNSIEAHSARRLTAKQALFQRAARLRAEAQSLEELASVIIDSLPSVSPAADELLWRLVQRA